MSIGDNILADDLLLKEAAELRNVDQRSNVQRELNQD